jgi:hypothetical protein
MTSEEQNQIDHIGHVARHPDSLPVRDLVQLVQDLQLLMYGTLSDRCDAWDPAKQSRTSPADLQQDLELLMRKFNLVPRGVPNLDSELTGVLYRPGVR